jgi:hypothetical protein
MAHKLGRNDPCFCQSGKKYKHCHMRRESMPRPTAHAIMAPLQRALGRKTCWHRGVDGSPCGKVVKAHTVPQAMSLRRIAEGGHVIGLLHRVPTTTDARPLLAGRVGVAGASTFLGFCREHDSRVFAPLEARPFTGEPEQLWLLQYRSLCRELYLKEGNVRALLESRQIADRGLGARQQLQLQSFLGDFIEGTQAGLQRLRLLKRLFDDTYRQADWSSMHGVVIWFAASPPLMCSGLVEPDFDFAGHRLPDSSGSTIPNDAVSLDVVGAGDRGAAVLAWRAEHHRPGEALARTLLALPHEQIADALVRLVFEGTENWFGRPSWWDALPAPVRADLEVRLACGSPARSHRPQCLAVPTATYGMPAVADVQLVNWAG